MKAWRHLLYWAGRGVLRLPAGTRVESVLASLGCKIGRGVYMDTTDITEFDCISIGDHSEINALACPQTHLFEDRVMKIDHVTIGEGVCMGARSAVRIRSTSFRAEPKPAGRSG